MSVDGRGDAWISVDPVVDGAKAQAIKADVEASLSKFEQYRKTILTVLRNEYQGSPKLGSFDEIATSDRLTRFAHSFLLQERVKQEAMPPADRRARLAELTTALKRSRTLVEEMHDDVADDLFAAWCEGTSGPLASVVSTGRGSYALDRVPERMFTEAVAALAALETAAHRAANEAHEMRGRRGRPKGTKVLPEGSILELAAQYRESTGAKPGSGSGPFVRFVLAFLFAVGRATISEDYIIELVKEVRSRTRTHLNGNEASPFDD